MGLGGSWSLPLGVFMTIEGGRSGAKGPIRYPILMGIILLGMSVSIPLLWVPAYIWGRGEGPVNPRRLYFSVVAIIPPFFLSALVFLVDTDSYLWRLSAGILSGPLLAVVSGSVLFFDVSPNKESKTAIAKHVKAVEQVYGFMTVISLMFWVVLVRLTLSSYGFDFKGIWSAIYTDADPGIAFLTFDYILISNGVIFGFFAYQCWPGTAVKILLAVPFLGPAALAIAAERFELAESEKNATQGEGGVSYEGKRNRSSTVFWFKH